MYYVSKHAKLNYDYIAEYIQSLYIIQIFVIILKFLWLDIRFREKSIPLYLGPLSLETRDPDAPLHNIYLSAYSETKTNLILLVSGLYYQSYTQYMEKVYLDFNRNPLIREKYIFMVYENKTKSNYHIAKDISQCVEQIVEKYKIQELVVVGFSAGGIVSSHIMSYMKHIPISKKIITYDCPLDIYSTMIYQYNNYSRLDIYFYMIVRFFYETNAWAIIFDAMKQHIRSKEETGPAIFPLVKKIYGKTDEEVREMGEFCLIQDKNTDLHFINCVGDPLFQPSIRDNIIKKAREQGFNPKIYEKRQIGHCCDMAYSDVYLSQLLDAILTREIEEAPEEISI